MVQGGNDVLLPAPETLGPDFSVRQHVVVETRGHTGSFDAVLQKRGGELVMVGLVGGERAFVLRQTRAGITFEQSFGPPLPFPARDVIRDVHRVYFARLPRSADAPTTGVRTGHVGDEDVVETWRDGALAERRFLAPGRADGVTVTYSAGCDDERCAPARVRIVDAPGGTTVTLDSDDYTFF